TSPVNPGGVAGTEVIYAGTGSYSSTFATFTQAGMGGPAVGIYKSIDGGATWSVLNPTTVASPNGIFAGLPIERIIPTTLNGGKTVFRATAVTGTDGLGKTTGGVYRSDDGGGRWTRLSGGGTGLPNSGVTDLVENPNDANQFFAAVPKSFAGASAGIYELD